MLANFIWFGAIALETIILLRGSTTGLLKKYPLFYSYIGCVLVKEIIGLITNVFAPKLYEPLYWPTELATILASYAVIIEVFRCATRHKPGIRRLTQNALLSVFVLTVAYAASDLWHGGGSFLSRPLSELWLDSRHVEAAILLVMLWLLMRYRIPLGRNLRCVI